MADVDHVLIDFFGHCALLFRRGGDLQVHLADGGDLVGDGLQGGTGGGVKASGYIQFTVCKKLTNK